MADEPDSGDRRASSGASGSAGLTGRDLIGIGGLLVGGVVLGLVVGLLVDHAADTSPVFTLVGIALGIVLAAAGFVVRVRAALRG